MRRASSPMIIVPNLFTATSLVLGLVASVLSLEGRFEIGAWCILWCVLLDKLDGTAARLLGATSRFGVEFDSMADLVAFGLAPAAIVYSATRGLWEPWSGRFVFLVVCTGFYALSAAVRLSRFNVQDTGTPKAAFSGIPSTLCGAILPSAVLVFARHAFPREIMLILPALMAVLALGMLSPLPVPKLSMHQSRIFNAFQIANIVLVYIFTILRIYPEFLLGIALSYLVVGAAYVALRPERFSKPLISEEG